MEGRSERVRARFILRHDRPSLLRLAWPGLLGLAFLGSMLLEGEVSSDQWGLAVLIVLVSVVGPFIVFGLLARPAPEQWIEVRARSLVLPASAFSREAVEIPISEVRSIYARLAHNGMVWIETTYKTFTFPARLFESMSSAALLVDRVRERIRELPDGDGRVATIDRDARIAELALSTRHPGTIGAITLLVVASLLLYFGGGLDRMFALVRFGANVEILVKDGQLYRLISALFLHSSLIHLGFVVFGIAAAGSIVERLLGTAGALTIMLVSGLAGELAMLAGGSILTLGASPIAFGLMGAAAFITHQHRKRIPTLLVPSTGVWILIGVFTLPIALIPEADFSAHIGGLLGGVVTGALLAGDGLTLPIRGARPPWAMVTLAILGALYAAGLGQAALAFVDPAPDDEVRTIERYLELDLAPYEELNRLAWELALTPAATEKGLELAELAAQRAVDRSTDESLATIEDTLATVQYRRRRFPEAIAHEKHVLQASQDAFTASQLARFFQAAGTTSTHAVTLRLDAGALEVGVEAPMEKRAAVYVLAVKDGSIKGLLTFPLEPGAASSRIVFDEKERPTFAEGAELITAEVDEGARISAGAWKWDERATTLPVVAPAPDG